MRPAYRRLLVQLKRADPEAFQEAGRRYREEVEPATDTGETDPVSAWLEYGAWLAGRLSDGRPLEIDSSGRARPCDPAAPAAGAMIIWMPHDDRTPATMLAMPSILSDSQRETAELLVG